MFSVVLFPRQLQFLLWLGQKTGAQRFQLVLVQASGLSPDTLLERRCVQARSHQASEKETQAAPREGKRFYTLSAHCTSLAVVEGMFPASGVGEMVTHSSTYRDLRTSLYAESLFYAKK